MTLETDLQRDEGLRLYVYDDATGKPIAPGYTVVGHPTIGYGRALDVEGITEVEAEFLLSDDTTAFSEALAQILPWTKNLDTVRCNVLIEMAFNMGVAGLLSFKNTLAAVQSGQYATAAVLMLKSSWATQVGARATRLSQAMASGVDPLG